MTTDIDPAGQQMPLGRTSRMNGSNLCIQKVAACFSPSGEVPTSTEGDFANTIATHESHVGEASTHNTRFEREAGAVTGRDLQLSESARLVHYMGKTVKRTVAFVLSAVVAAASRSGDLFATSPSASIGNPVSESHAIDEGIPMGDLSINTLAAESGIHGVAADSILSPDLERQSSTSPSESELWSATVWKRRLLTVVVIMVVSSLMYTTQLVVVSKINGGHSIQFCTSTGCEIGVPSTKDLDRILATMAEGVNH